jgi:hypothetical protein
MRSHAPHLRSPGPGQTRRPHASRLAFVMKAIMTTRSYVWAFCFYLALTLQMIFSSRASMPSSHLDPSFFTLFNGVFIRLFCAWIFLLLIRHTANWVERTVLILSAIRFVLMAMGELRRLDYIPLNISPQISHWTFFVATVLLGYRTDQILKQQDKRIETITCSIPS